jgi:iron-sulfur cluster protein
MSEKRDLAREIRAALADDNLKAALWHAVSGINDKRRGVLARFPGYEEARDAARRIKEHAIADLPQLIDRFADAVRANGGEVYHAEDGEAACRIIADIAREHGAERITKSKSMTSEEIHLNGALEAAGMQVRETDLGEYIVQLAEDRPSHVTAPIIHMSVEDVRRVFRERLGVEDVPEQPEELTQLARTKLREEFLSADLGITGANFLLADTGTVVIVENEGNARLTTQVPPTHVVLAGIEKLLPTAADLLPFLELLPRTATGQLLTSYLSFISGPGWSGPSPFHPGVPRSFHVVLLDNGRRAMRDDELLTEALYCIRCGGCMTVCPPYQVVGGHVYGGPTYPSGIGNAWEAGVRGLETAAQFNALCTTCSRCQDVCPLHIDIPWMNTVLRERIAELERRPRGLFERMVYDRVLPTEEEGAVSLGKRIFSDPRRIYRRSRRQPWRTLMRLTPTRAVVARMAGLASARPMPEPEEETFSAWFRKRRGSRVATTPLEAQRLCNDRRGSTAFLFVDCHTENIETEVGKAAISCLEKCGVAVVLVSGQCCGRAALSQGMLRTARTQAETLQKILAPAVKTGHQIIGIEPSCLAALVDDHPKLLPGSSAAEVAASCREVLGVMNRRLAAVDPAKAPRWKPAPAGEGERVVLHGHCQQKTLGWMSDAVEMLGAVPGIDLRVTTAECCGMAGSFGYKSDFYALSVEIGRRLVDEIDALGADSGERLKIPAQGCRTVACGTSCRSQVADLGSRRVVHPLQLIDERLEKR